jgi:hypothetical protein
MKRSLILCLVAGVSFASGRVFNGIPTTAAAVGEQGNGGAAKCTAKNGDVNADGTVDLSDAVTILGHLFLGRPAQLVPLCTPPSALTATGQSLCTDANGNAIDCESATCGGQDGFYRTGCPSKNRFTDNGDGTVTDNCTGLMWEKNVADTDGDGKLDPADVLPWCSALSYCEHLTFAKHDDWRLPNVRELQSIMDYGRFSPAIDPVFGALNNTWSWSSTSEVAFPDRAWKVQAFHGDVATGAKDDTQLTFLRAVRNAP